jgi:hypothetical protein
MVKLYQPKFNEQHSKVLQCVASYNSKQITCQLKDVIFHMGEDVDSLRLVWDLEDMGIVLYEHPPNKFEKYIYILDPIEIVKRKLKRDE